MKALLCTLVLWLWGAHVRAAAPTWWSPLPFESNPGLSDEQLALIDQADTRADLFEPLWRTRAYGDEMKAAFGAPDLEGIDGADWIFTNLMVRIDETKPGATVITMYANADAAPGLRTFDPTRVAFGVYAPATASCTEAVAHLGKPSSAVNGEALEWSTLGRGRDAHLSVLCMSVRDSTSLVVRLTAATPEQLAGLVRPITAVPLPKTFVPAPANGLADPRPLWPRALMPAQPLSDVVAALGPPGWIVRNAIEGTDHLFYGKAMRIDGDSAGRVVGIAIDSHATALQQRFAFKSPLLASVGKPNEVLRKAIGAPTDPAFQPRRWYWDAAGHQLTIEASDEDGLVTGLTLRWSPPVDRAALGCARALAAAPTPPSPAVTYRAPDSGQQLAHTQFLPFGLWFGASPRDVFDRIGLPRHCGDFAMSYRGLELSFDDDKLIIAEFRPRVLTPELRERNDPLAALFMKGGLELQARLGTYAASRHALYERGDEHITLVHNDDPEQPFYAARLVRGFSYDGIEGIDLLKVEASAQRLESPTIAVVKSDDGVAAELSLDAKQALAGRVKGRFLDLLGAPWTTLVTTLGAPSEATTSKTEIVITWRWRDDPFGRSVAYRCRGAAPKCDTLIVGAQRSTLSDEGP